jgi:NAD dependent epimerase/dehydratase family enzyme
MKILFGEMSELVLTGRKALPKKLQHFGYEFQFPGALDALRTVI